MEKFTFKNHDGEEKRLDLKIKKKIGSGSYGDIFDTDAHIEHNGKTKIRQFALKKFKPVMLEDENVPPQKSSKHSMEVYGKLKEIGLPTWTTYRISEKRKEILMTFSGNRENQYIIDISKNPTNEDYRLSKDGLEEIVNLEETIQKMIELFTSATISIEALWDSFFQIYDKKEKALYPIIGDFDTVFIDEEEPALVKLTNIRTLMNFMRNIEEFLSHFVSDEKNKEKYLHFVKEQMSKISEEFKKSGDKHSAAHI